MSHRLNSLVENLFQLQNYSFQKDVTLQLGSRDSIDLSYILQRSSQNDNNQPVDKLGVIIPPDNNLCTHKTILRAQEVQSDGKLSRMIVVAQDFTPLAKELAENFGIITFNYSELTFVTSLYDLGSQQPSYDP
ncbi:hypothetical protein [Candidatus Hodarchaeum mangrovi]